MRPEVTIAFWSWQLVFAMALNCVVVSLTIGAYASRLAGARSGRVATAISLFNLFSTAGRLAAMLYTPILGALADNAGLSAQGSVRAAALTSFEWQLRLIVLGGAAGAILGTLFLPTFVMLYARAIDSFERRGSVPKAALQLLRPRTFAFTIRSIRLVRFAGIRQLSARNIPKNVLILNALVTSVYGIGVVAAAYASVVNPAAARTALLSSGLINGFATIAYNVVVDPTSALFTDKVVKGERSIDDVRALVAYLSLSAIAGFMLSQILLIPCARALVWASSIVTGR
ncbi:MAG: lipid II flippase Amj [Vulcanimicrobiaceae bacterium]